MSRHEVFVCDRCKQQYDSGNNENAYVRVREGTFDLCNDCTKELKEFLKVWDRYPKSILDSAKQLFTRQGD